MELGAHVLVADRASNEYSKNSNFEYELVNPCILEFEYEARNTNRMDFDPKYV